MPRPSGGIGRREPCAKCGLPVFIAERLNVGKQLYHRTCFRCARCNSQLTLANYYETETENQFCCETCPDEEHSKQDELDDSSLNEKMVLSRSLSDEEKSAGLQKFDDQDDYSATFESALENPEDKSLAKNYTLNAEQSSLFVQARSRFITSQLEKSDVESSEDELIPDLPKTEPPSLPKSEPPTLPKTEPPDFTDVDSVPDSSENIIDVSKDLGDSVSSIVNSTQSESFDSGYPSNVQSLDLVVNSSAKISEISDKNQPETATKQLDVNEFITKENKFLEEKRESTSLVKSRMLLFENKKLSDESNERFISSGTKSPEKFIHKVPLEEKEEQSSTGLHIEKSEVDVESDSNISNSIIDINNKNNENHMEVKDIQIEKGDTIITISSETNSADKSIVVSDTTDQSPIVISDSVSEIKSEDSENTSKSLEVSASTKSEDYPEDLNPFGEDEVGELEAVNKKAQVSLNPFDEDEDLAEEEERKPSPKPAVRKKIKVRPSNAPVSSNTLDNTLDHIGEIYTERHSYNPFEEEEKQKKEESKSRPYANTLKIIPAPRISLNPFWSDGEEPDDEENEKLKPVPLPRNPRSSVGTPEPKPRKSGLSVHSGLSSSIFGSSTSISSANSNATTGRKKKQAPKPPSAPDKQDSAHSSVASSPSPSVQHSPKLTPRIRKTKKAPLPPSTATSTPFMATIRTTAAVAEDLSPIICKDNENETPSTPTKSTSDASEWEKEKIIKDKVNRNRQSQALTSPISSDESSLNLPVPNKSTYGKWKRRKGPAPSRPIPQRRNIKPLPLGEIKRELEFIEIQQQGLEKQGVRLEQIIREKCEGPNVDLDSSLAPETEDLILQLFELVNEKNELFRKQAELMYLRRQQRLEEEYADLEYQIRCLMLQPEANKTDCDKSREEELISRLIEVVERRNEIVECLEMDRVRAAEEDDSINNQLNLYALKREEDPATKTTLEEAKHKKKSKKEKKFKFKHTKKVDVDKDIDECESSGPSSLTKDKKKKKFNIF